MERARAFQTVSRALWLGAHVMWWFGIAVEQMLKTVLEHAVLMVALGLGAVLVFALISAIAGTTIALFAPEDKWVRLKPFADAFMRTWSLLTEAIAKIAHGLIRR